MFKVLVIGDINLDVFCGLERLPEKHHETHMKSADFSLGGNAANFAVGCAKLGLETELCCAIGTDLSSDYLKSSLASAGVGLAQARRKGPNGCSIVFVYPDGEKAIMSNKGVAATLSVADVSPAALKLGRGDVLYIGGYFHVPGLKTGLPALLKKVKVNGAVVALDMCYDTSEKWDLNVLPLLDVIFTNEVELEKLTGSSGREGAEKLMKAGAREVVLKLGPLGSEYFSGNLIIRQDAMKVKSVDSTGCGDLFNAGFIFARLKGLRPGECLAAGTFVAGNKCRKHGLFVAPAARVLGYAKK